MAVTDYWGWGSVEGVSSYQGKGWVYLDINGDVSWYTTNPSYGPDQVVTIATQALVSTTQTHAYVRIQTGQIIGIDYWG